MLTCMAKQLEYIPKVRQPHGHPTLTSLTPAHSFSVVLKCRLLNACAAWGVVQAVLGAVIEVAVIKLFDWAEFLHAFRVGALPPLPCYEEASHLSTSGSRV